TGVDLRKWREGDRDLSLAHANPGIPHGHHRSTVRASVRTYTHRAARRRELDGVADEVVEDLPQLGRVAAHGRDIVVDASVEGHAEVRRMLLEAGERRAEYLFQFDLARIERVTSALHLGDVEDIVDDGEQMRGRVANEVGVLDDLPPGEPALLVFADQL